MPVVRSSGGEGKNGQAESAQSEAPPVLEKAAFGVRATSKGEVIRTPYGSVLVGMNSVVVEARGHLVPMPVSVAEALFGYKTAG
jgi:hypothetical protein